MFNWLLCDRHTVKIQRDNWSRKQLLQIVTVTRCQVQRTREKQVSAA